MAARTGGRALRDGAALASRTRSILLAGDPVLSRACRPLVRSELPSARLLADELLRAMRRDDGRGLAAPQLGEAVRLLVVQDGRNFLDAPGPAALVNPRVLDASSEHVWEWESCLSVPGYAALVLRPRTVDVEFETLPFDGSASSKLRRTLTGESARVFQHEADHLDGVLFTDVAARGSLIHESAAASPATRRRVLQRVLAAAEDYEEYDGDKEPG